MKYLLLLIVSLSLSYLSSAKELVDISGKTDMKVYYEFTESNGDLLYPVFTSTAGTSSSYTGPSQPPSGVEEYGYLETSKGHAYYQGDSAILTFESTNGFYQSGSKSLEFYYHMYGSNIGSIEVQRKRCFLGGGCYWESIWTASGQEQTSSNEGWTKKVIDIAYDYGLHFLRIKLTANGGWKGDIGLANIKVTSRSPSTISCDAPSGTLIETIYNSDGSKDFTVSLAEDADFQRGDIRPIDVNYSTGTTIEKDYNSCSNEGVLGYVTDEGDGEFIQYPACWKRGSGFFTCP